MARPPETFTQGAFGPVNPIPPANIDQAPQGLPRPQPRRWEYPVAWNMPTPPGTEGIRLAPFQVLRAYADMSTFLRACIEKRIEEILGLEWDIVPTMEAEKSMGTGVGVDDFQERRIKALQWFSRPDPEYDTFHTWLRAALEDLFVIDALSIYIAPPLISGHGLFGTDVAALTLIDGTTIRPLVDLHGGRPAPPAVAFQQYMYGVPRVDLIDVISQDELDKELGPPSANLRGDQLLYLPYRRRTKSPYGFSHVESCLVPTGVELAKQKYVLSYYDEGNVPAAWLTIGNADTPQQVRQWQDALDAMIGDIGARHQVFALPDGSASQPTRPNAMQDNYDMSNKEEILANFALTAMEMGMLPGGKSGGMSAGSSMAKAGQDESLRSATMPLLMFLKRNLFDLVLQQFAGQKDMQWHWKGLEPAEDQQKTAAMEQADVVGGIRSRDEIRRGRGYQPWGLPLTSEPTVTTPQGVISLATGAMANPTAMDPAASISASPDSPGSTPLHEATPAPQNGGTTPPKSVSSKPPQQDPKNSDKPDKPEGGSASKSFGDANNNQTRDDHGRFGPSQGAPSPIEQAQRIQPGVRYLSHLGFETAQDLTTHLNAAHGGNLDPYTLEITPTNPANAGASRSDPSVASWTNLNSDTIIARLGAMHDELHAAEGTQPHFTRGEMNYSGGPGRQGSFMDYGTPFNVVRTFTEVYGKDRAALEEQRSQDPQYVALATKAAYAFAGVPVDLPFDISQAQTPLEVLDLVAAYCYDQKEES